MNELVVAVFDLLKKKQISRDVARILLDSVQHIPETSPVEKQDKRIAIIGIAAELPGARTFDEFWDVLDRREDRVSDLSPERQILCEDFIRSHGDSLDIDKDKPLWDAAWIDDIDKFDAAFFHITPAEARVMDPQQRRFLQATQQCFEDAGYAGPRIRDSKTGVYVSAAMVNYADALTEFTPQCVPGNIPSFVASRVAYTYNLHGPSYVCSSTCASSLLALHEACLGLLGGDCDLALVGGVNIFPFPVNAKKIFMNAAGIMSDDQHCRPFDNQANGIGRGEGVVAILLKPLAKALADRDNIHAVILGSAVNNDGTSAGITAPNPKAHTELMLEAWRRAEIVPDSLSYIEAHGTGTHLGDPIEIRGITDAVRQFTDKRQFIALGSIKGNIGHLLDGVAGLSGLIKVLHVLKRGIVPPTKYLQEPNRHIDFLDSPVFVPTFPWDLRASRTEPLRAAVNCFGFNGTNVHCVLEESPANQSRSLSERLYVFPLSARTQQSLTSLVAKYAALKENFFDQEACDVAYTLWSGREHFEQRLAITASSTREFSSICRELASTPPKQWYTITSVSSSASSAAETDCKPKTASFASILANTYIHDESCPWHRLFEGVEAHKVSLPTYAFDESSYWVSIKTDDASCKEMECHTGTTLEKVLSITCAILEVETLKAEDNFLSCGGNSLFGLQLISRIKKELHYEITHEDLLTLPDFRAIAEKISTFLPLPTPTAITMVAQAQDYLTSFAQRRLWIIEQFSQEKTAYTIPFVFEVEGYLETDLLKETFDILSMRHESLRTTFVYRENELRQSIADVPLYTFVFEDFSTHRAGREAALQHIEDWKAMQYDLETGPLLRVLVYKISPTRSLFSLMMHHLIVDGWSLVVLSNELLKTYNACKEKVGYCLPPIATRYVDYCAWQRELLSGPLLQKQEKFWQTFVENDLPVTEIVGDRPRPAVFRFTGNIKHFDLSPELSTAMRSIAQQESATLYMVLVSSVYTLIHRMSGSTDMVIGSPVSGRNHVDLEPIIGLFTNTLALRVQLRSDDSFTKLVQAVRETVLAAFDHQDYPFDLLVDTRGGVRDTSRSPIFNINVALQNFKFDASIAQTLGGAVLSQLQTRHRTCKWDLEFEFVEQQDGTVSCNLEYYDGMYSEQFIESLIITYLDLLHAVVLEQGMVMPLFAIPLLHGANRKEILRLGKGTSTTHQDTAHSFLARILEQGTIKPNAIALTDPTGSITYRELIAQSRRLADRIQSVTNADESPSALLLLEKNRNVLYAILACLLAGVTFIPVAPHTPRKRLHAIIHTSHAQFILTETSFFSSADRLLYESTTLSKAFVLDANDIESVASSAPSDLMDESLWNFFAEKEDTAIGASGWVSSYTGQSFTPLEMREYVSNAVSKILCHLHPGATLVELGCGSALTTFELAPHTVKYTACDLSDVIIRRNRGVAASLGLSHLEFAVAAAHEGNFLSQENTIDAVIINSVVHCFPNYSYLRAVLARAVFAVKEGGFVFLGDLLNLDLKEDFVGSLFEFKERNRDKNYLTKTDWETDLFMNPEILNALVENLGADIRVDCSSKVYTQENEITKYRFDAVLHVVSKQKRNPLVEKSGQGKKMLEAYRGWMEAHHDFPYTLLNCSPAAPAYILFTSGSTGQPKGVAVSNANLNNYLTWAQHYYAPDSEQISMPFFTSLAFDLTITSIFLPLLTGGTVFACPGEFDAALERLCAIPDALVMKGTPKQIQLILEREELKAAITCFILGGEALPAQLCRQIFERFPDARIVNEYGPTEATVGTIALDVTCRELEQGWTHLPIGRPIDNTTVYIVNDQGEPVPPFGIGEIALAGESVALGYLGDTILTRQKFQANSIEHLEPGLLYRTGDLGQLLPSGIFLCFGRKDQMVKVRGFRIELEEIESHLRRVPGIRAAAACVYKDPMTQTEQLYAYIEADFAIDLEHLREFLARELPEYLIPTFIERLERIPLTANGKLDRKSLPSPESLRQNRANTNGRSPSTNEEKVLLAIWRDLLGEHVNDVRADFFSLGGDSIKALRLLSAARTHGLTLAISDIFEKRTIEYLAALAGSRSTRQGHVPERPQLPVPQAKKLSLAPMQKWFFAQAFEMPHYWNLSMSVVLVDDFNLDRLERSLRRVVIAHEALLTWFECDHKTGTVSVTCEPELITTLALQKFPVSGDSSSQIQAQIEEIQFHIQDTFRFERRLPLQAAVFTADAMPPLLTLFVHHLLIDGVSWRILMNDLEKAYVAESQGVVPDLLPAAQFSDWLDTVQHESMNNSTALDYWRELRIADVHPLFRTEMQHSLTLPMLLQIRRKLDSDTTKHFLKARSLSQHHTPDAIVATAFGAAFTQVFGGDGALFLFEGHGRGEETTTIDVSRTIGWFTTMFPLRIPKRNSLRTMLRETNSTLRSLRGGVPYMVARWIQEDESVQYPQPTLLVNYLGQFDGDIRTAQDDNAPVFRYSEKSAQASPIHPENHCSFNVELNLFVLDGSLQASLEFDPDRITEAQATALMDALFNFISDLSCTEGEVNGERT